MGSQKEPTVALSAGLTVRLALPQDVTDLAPRLRTCDSEECYRAADKSPVDALEQGLADSERCLTIDWGGRPIAMFGVVPGLDGFGHVWLLGSDDVVSCAKTLMLHAEALIAEVGAGYRVLGNSIDAENKVHLRWLVHMGFNLAAPAPMGPTHAPFITFWRNQPCAHQQQP